MWCWQCCCNCHWKVIGVDIERGIIAAVTHPLLSKAVSVLHLRGSSSGLFWGKVEGEGGTTNSVTNTLRVWMLEMFKCCHLLVLSLNLPLWPTFELTMRSGDTGNGYAPSSENCEISCVVADVAVRCKRLRVACVALHCIG